MNNIRVLITGGAGFIGARVAKRLLAKGIKVRILDCLLPQVHFECANIPTWMQDNCDVHIANVCDAERVRAALVDVDAIIHLAAETGPAQSMYEIDRYFRQNVQGTATILQEALTHRDIIQRLIVASSRAIYGEGKYRCAVCGPVYPDPRADERLRLAQWEPICPKCSSELKTEPTDESSPSKPSSQYAVTKLAQEQMCLVFGRAYGVPTRALRYQNVYGGGQSLKNPYVGVLAIFASQIRNGRTIDVYEDGSESRDFVHVDDVASATVLALEDSVAGAHAINVGSGIPSTLLQVAKTLFRVIGMPEKFNINGKYRVGDIRHCFADLTQARSLLGYVPNVTLENGLKEFVDWAMKEPSYLDNLDNATSELKKLNLFR